MKTIDQIIQKINSLHSKINSNTNKNSIEIDLMMDYCRQLYDALMDKKNQSNYVVKEKSIHIDSSSKEDIKTETTHFKKENLSDNTASENVINEEEVDKKSNEKIQEAKLSPIKENAISINEKMKKSDKELSHKMSHTHITDLQKAIGVNEKFRFINGLFKGDGVAFEQTLKNLNSNYSSTEDAISYLNKELKVKYKWEDEDELVEELKTLIERRYLG